MLTDTFIQTKLQPPTLSPDTLLRPKLIQRLENGRYRKLSLISAPAGYGKSVLARIWQESCDCPVAWLSLDKNDNDLRVFLSYVVSAIQTIFPKGCEDTTFLLNGMQLPPSDLLTTSLINETAVLPNPFILVLDDYHLIQNPDIHQLINTLIQYQSPHMHLALITRQDPPVDLVNLRAKNQVTEIRLSELRFNESEAKQYLKISLGDSLSPDLANQLIERTEGWAVGLRLAVLAFRNQIDELPALETYQGSNHYIMSYLVKEVLQQQPQQIQIFLLYTSLLDRFCTPLCDALLNINQKPRQPNSQEILEHLRQDNLFLISLDPHGEWFRYHHLFQDLLRHQLKTAVAPGEISNLHKQASIWFAQHGFVEEALDHAFEADNMQLAVQILDQAKVSLLNETQWQKLEQLLRRFPRNVVEQSPELLIIESWIFYHNGQYPKLPAALANLRQQIDQTELAHNIKTNLLGEINSLNSIISYYAMDIDGTIKQSTEALKQTNREFWISRILARLMLAGAYLMIGDKNNAYSTIYQAFDEEPIQSKSFKAALTTIVCNVDWLAADVKGLQQNAMQAIQQYQDVYSPEMLGYAHFHLGTAHYLLNDLTAAEQHFSYVNERPYTTYGDAFAHSACGLASTYQTQGRDQEARDVVDAALAFLLVTGNSRLLMVMKAFQIELALQQGQVSAAIQWANQIDSIPPLTPMTRLYVPHFTLVKIWLTEKTPVSLQKAADLLSQLKTFTETTHNTLFLIQTLILEAISYQLSGDKTNALATLERALTLALPSGIICFFIDFEPIMVSLLTNLKVDNTELLAYKNEILSAMTPTPQPLLTTNDTFSLIEPLTERELDVLTLLSQRQTDKEIAQKLHISPHTVRTHTKNIYTKLDVNNRRAAALRARELGLVSPE